MTSRLPKLSVACWLMLVGLLPGVILQPVLASMGELHELTHAQASAHGATAAEMPEGDGDGAGALHQIHHFAHCCGHIVMAPPVALMLAEVRHREPRERTESSLVSNGYWLAPFRPPITRDAAG